MAVFFVVIVREEVVSIYGRGDVEDFLEVVDEDSFVVGGAWVLLDLEDVASDTAAEAFGSGVSDVATTVKSF